MDYPILLTPEGKYEAILNHAYDIFVEDELLSTNNGYETLSFVISNYDKKRPLIHSERLVEVQGRRYIVRVIEDQKNSHNTCLVTCDATWYDLNDGELKYLMHTDQTTIDARTSVEQQLRNTGWKVGLVDVPGTRPKHTADVKETSLYNLRQISGNFGGELFFDTANQTVSLLANMGVRHQKIFCYEKNTTSIKRVVDSRNLVTRFSLIGNDADGNEVTVADINDGKEYVENYDWYDRTNKPRKLKWYRKKDNRWSDKQNMLDYMKDWIAVYSQPVVSYELSVSLFEISPNLGDYVYVYDKDLNIRGWLRVVSRRKNILLPHSSTVQLESTQRTIVETIVSGTTASQETQEIVSAIATTGGELRMPAGVEGWLMQYSNGQWQAKPIPLPQGYEGYVMQFVNGEWTASNIIGDINRVLDALNGEVL